MPTATNLESRIPNPGATTQSAKLEQNLRDDVTILSQSRSKYHIIDIRTPPWAPPVVNQSIMTFPKTSKPAATFAAGAASARKLDIECGDVFSFKKEITVCVQSSDSVNSFLTTNFDRLCVYAFLLLTPITNNKSNQKDPTTTL